MTQVAAAPEDKLDFKRILPIFIIVLVDLLGLTIIIPLLPYYAVEFGANPFLIGVLAAAYPIMQLIGGPLLGGLSDRFGRKPILLISQVGTFAGFILLGVSNTLLLVFLARIIDGISGANFVAAQAAITDSTTERNRTQGLGLIGAAFGIGFTLGPVIAFIALGLSGNDYRAPAFVAAAFSLLSILLTAFWFQETLPPGKRGQKRGRSGGLVAEIIRGVQTPRVGVLLVLMFLQQLVFGGLESLLALFNLSRLGMDGMGNTVVFVFVGVLIVLVQGKFIGPWSRKYGERRLIYAGLGLLSIGLILTAITPEVAVPWYSRAAIVAEAAGESGREIAVPLPSEANKGWVGLAWLFVAMVPATIGGGILSPSINSLITKRVSSTEVGGILGVSASLVSAANAITPIVGGTLFQLLGTTAPFLLGGIGMAALLAAALRHVGPGPEEAPQPAG